MLSLLENPAVSLSNADFTSNAQYWKVGVNASSKYLNESLLGECNPSLCYISPASNNLNVMVLNSTLNDIGIFQAAKSTSFASRTLLFTSKISSTSLDNCELRVYENNILKHNSRSFDSSSDGYNYHVNLFTTSPETTSLGIGIASDKGSISRLDNIGLYAFPSSYTGLAVFICGMWLFLFGLISFTHFSPRGASRSIGDRRKDASRFQKAWSFIVYVNRSLLESIKHSIENRVLAIWFLAYAFFSAGTTTVASLAGTYLKEQIQLSGSMTGIVLLASQLIGIPGAFLGHFIGKRLGFHATTCISYCLFALSVILGYLLWLDSTTPIINIWIVILVFGIAGGSGIALTRASFSGMIPKGREAEFMGMYNFFNKVLSSAGPALFTAVNESQRSFRLAFLSLVSFFSVAIVLQILVVSLSKSKDKSIQTVQETEIGVLEQKE
jgi:hypothetical protein